MLANFSKVLSSIITPTGKPVPSSEITILSYSLAEGITKELREKNNLPKETIDQVGLLFATELYTTSLTIGIPNDSYDIKAEQVVYSSNAILQYIKKIDFLINILSLYLTNAVSVTNEVINGTKNLTFFINTMSELLIFSNSIQYYLMVIKREEDELPKIFSLPDVKNQFQSMFDHITKCLKDLDVFRGMKEQQYSADLIKNQEEIYNKDFREFGEQITKKKELLQNVQKKIQEKFKKFFFENSFFDIVNYFNKFIYTVSAITMLSCEIIKFDPEEFLNAVSILQNILTGTFTMVTAYYLAIRKRISLEGCNTQSLNAYKQIGPYVDSLSALLSKTIPKCSSFLYDYLRSNFMDLFTEIQRLYVDYERQTKLISSLIKNDSNQSSNQSQIQQLNQPEIQQQLNQPEIQQQLNQPEIQQQLNHQKVQQLLNQHNIQESLNQSQIQQLLNQPNVQKLIIQSQTKQLLNQPNVQQMLNQLQMQQQPQIQPQPSNQQNSLNCDDSDLNEKILKLQEENEQLKKEYEKAKKEIDYFKEELQKIKIENASLRKNSNNSDYKKERRELNNIKPVTVDEIDNMKNKTLIGQGGQSRVYKVSKDTFFALKELEITNNTSDNYNHLRRLLQEHEIINCFNHPNIIKTFGICFGDKTHPPSIILEFCPFNLLKCVKDLQDFERISVIFEICSAMNEVHENHLIHRDLKPENILMDEQKHVKVSDFGIARLNEIEGEQSKTLGIGTLKFMAPEILNEDKFYNEKVDVYSFGVILFFILTNGEYPKISISEIATGKKANIPININEISRQLILRCWSFKSDDRPSFKDIIEYIKSNNFKLIDGIEYQVPKIKEFLSI